MTDVSTIVEVIDQERCVGCGACVNACPVDALCYKTDPWGYYVPQVDAQKCIMCGKCKEVCPVFAHRESSNVEDEVRSFCFVSGDKELLKASSSGAIFSHLAKYILNKGGAVYGAAWGQDLRVKHISIRDESEMDKLRKSKYLQSNIGYSFREVQNDIENGTPVLFSGCPCQVAGLKQLLGKDYDNLYTVDLFCGNAPSADFFNAYLLEEFHDGVASYNFRDKTNGWRADCESITLNTGEKLTHTGTSEDSYQSIYHDHTMCPVHCEQCMFHELPRYGDISIGDFWGIQNQNIDIDSEHGVSVVLVNNVKGRKIYETVSTDAAVNKEIPISWIGGNGYLRKGSSNFVSQFRDLFYRIYIEKGYGKAVEEVNRQKLSYIRRRYEGDYNLLKEWIELQQTGKNIGEVFIQKGYNKIGIYGMGDIGSLLVRELESSDVEVAYIIDRNPRVGFENIQTYGLNDLYPDVDAIVVTIEWDMEKIASKLIGKTGSDIIALSEIFR